MTIYGSTINFYGGLGESPHKQFTKAPGVDTHQRVAQSTKQIAERVYKSMVFEVVHELVISIDSEYELSRSLLNDTTGRETTLQGQYELTGTSVNADGESGVCKMMWKSKNNTEKFRLCTTCTKI